MSRELPFFDNTFEKGEPDNSCLTVEFQGWRLCPAVAKGHKAILARPLLRQDACGDLTDGIERSQAANVAQHIPYLLI